MTSMSRVVLRRSVEPAYPSCVVEGFVREDMAEAFEHLPPGKPFERGTVFLRRGVKPVVGAYVKMQVTTKPEWNKEFKETVSSALMGGKIHTVKSAKRVVATMEVTNMPASESIDCGEWEVELEFKEEYEHPWVMVGMVKRVVH